MTKWSNQGIKALDTAELLMLLDEYKPPFEDRMVRTRYYLVARELMNRGLNVPVPTLPTGSDGE
jgi:hypothetical protein